MNYKIYTRPTKLKEPDEALCPGHTVARVLQ